MKKSEAKKAILAEWRALPPADRATEAHAKLFALGAAGRFKFRSGQPDHAVEIEGCLAKHIGKH